MNELIDNFLEYVASEFSEATQIAYASRLQYLQEYMNAFKISMYHLNHKTAQEFREWIKNKQWKPRTINLTLAVVSKFFSWLQDKEYIVENPFKGIKRTKVSRELPKPFKAEELKIMYQKVKDPHDRILFMFMHYAGLRLAEALKLKKSDISTGDKLKIKIKGKGNKERFTWVLSKDAQKEIEEYLSSLKGDNTLLYPYSRKHVEKIADQLKKWIPDFHCHRLRHTFACALAEKQYPIELIKELLGHSDIKTTQIYASYKPKEEVIPWIE